MASIVDPPLPTKAGGRGVCIFCGYRGKLTGEHVWPDQLRDLFPPMPEMFVRLLALDGQPLTERTWRGDMFANKVNATCHGCNHGWLNDLENRAMPWLRPMILGSSVVIPLGRDGQTAVAAYVLRVLILSAHMTPDPMLILPSAGRALFNHHAPSRHETVWIGHYEGAVMNFGVAVRRFKIDPGLHSPESSWSDAYMATLGVGKLAVQIFGHDGHYPMSIETRDPRVMVGIWPSTQNLGWPPALRLNDDGLRALLSLRFDPGSPVRTADGRLQDEAP